MLHCVSVNIWNFPVKLVETIHTHEWRDGNPSRGYLERNTILYDMPDKVRDLLMTSVNPLEIPNDVCSHLRPQRRILSILGTGSFSPLLERSVERHIYLYDAVWHHAMSILILS
jgi:hypothetical protein